MRDVQVLKKSIQDTVGAENRFPSVTPNEIADPQRNDNQLIENFFARTCVKDKKYASG